jgi:hypothetical protein
MNSGCTLSLRRCCRKTFRRNRRDKGIITLTLRAKTRERACNRALIWKCK